uniref:Uncharacterized protein n=1 Tax=Arundo donax TaxID=35708 RepID=A0A0A9HE54_ARUDO
MSLTINSNGKSNGKKKYLGSRPTLQNPDYTTTTKPLVPYELG